MTDGGGSLGTDATDADVGDEAAAPFDGGLLGNGSFETRAIGCGAGWNAIDNTTAEISAIAHSGANGCKVCTAEPGKHVVRAQIPADGGNFGMQAYFHAANDASAPLAYEEISFQQSNGNYAGGAKEKSVPLADGWTPVQVASTMPSTAVTVTVDVGLDAPDGGGCIVVDDVVLFRQ